MTKPEVFIVGGARTPMTDGCRCVRKRGLANACIGGGQDIAASVETV
jgi:hypothetical protein